MTRIRAGIALCLFIVLLSAVVPVFAQSTFKVVEVVVEGNKIASKSLILGVSSINLGSPLTPSVTQETINRLYGLDIFSDITIEAEEISGGLKVYIVVKELPKLSALKFEGNKKIDERDLKDELNLGVGGYISPYLIQVKQNEIKDLYGEKGYFQAVIKSILEYNPDSSSASLTFKIDEKSKVKVDSVLMTGNDKVISKEVISKMRNRRRGFLKSSNFAKDKYEEDLEKVINEFHKRGFIDAYMKSDSMSIDTLTNLMKIYLEVYEGPRYYFGDVNFVGSSELPAKYLTTILKFKSSDAFDIEKYNLTLEDIYSAYYDIGHLHIRIMDDRVTRNDSLIDITYDIAEGLPSQINLVKIVGNRRTKEKVIRRELSTLPGQTFTRALLIRSIRDVMALNYFTNVNPVPLNLPNGDVDVEFQVEEKQTGQISAGAGYNSQDKVVGNIGMGIPNFRGNGQNVSFNIDFGSRRNSFSLSFTEPWLFGRPTLLGSDIYSTNRRWYNDYTEGRYGGSLRLGKRLKWPDNYFRVYASYRIEKDRYYDFDESFVVANSYKALHIKRVEISDPNSLDPLKTIFVDTIMHTAPGDLYPNSIVRYDQQWNTASRFSINITRDSRNLPEFATSGSKFSYTFEKTGGVLGGFWNYTRHNITGAKFIPLFWKVALAAKFQFGAINSIAGSNDSLTLISDRYTPGGTAYDGIIRGYDDGTLTPYEGITESDTAYYYYDSLIVADSFNVGDITPDTMIVSTGQVVRVRGNYMFVTNLELQLPIVEQSIYALAFFDAGNSWLRWEHIRLTPDDLFKSAGVGFRIAVPGIGTIGFDYGYAFDEAFNQEKGWKWHFQVGSTFR